MLVYQRVWWYEMIFPHAFHGCPTKKTRTFMEKMLTRMSDRLVEVLRFFFRPIEVPWKIWFDNQWYLKNGILPMIMVFWYTMIWWYFTNWYHDHGFDIYNLMLMIIIYLSKLLSIYIYICYLNLSVISVHYIYTVFIINIPIQIKLSKLLSVYIYIYIVAHFCTVKTTYIYIYIYHRNQGYITWNGMAWNWWYT